MQGAFRTGIAVLDDHIGGFLRGKAYLVFGEPGTGKSLLGTQYVLCGIEHREPGIYLSMERPADLLAQADSLGLDLHPALERGDLTFLEYDQDVTGRIMRYGWKPFLEQLSTVGSGQRQGQRIVFDPIHPLFSGSTEEGRLRYDLRYLVETLEEWGWTTVFLNDRGATQGHPSLYRVFSEICSGVFELQDEVESLESSKYLFVHKLRQPSDRMRKIPFQILPGLGIVGVSPVESEKAHRRSPYSGPAAPAEDAAETSGVRARRKVLLADDDPFVRSLLRKPLREEFDLVMAEDGVEALTLTIRENPDVLVLDVVLPKLTGFEVCRSLRSSGFRQPILFVSGLSDPNERIRGLSLGGNDFIVKPFHVREVVAKIRNASHYRLDPGESAIGSIDLEALIQAAHLRALPEEEFRDKLETALQDVLRFGSSLGIVRFAWDAEAASAEATDRLRSELEQLTRPEDLLTFPAENQAAVVLNTENLQGTVAYIRKLRRQWASGMDGTTRFDLPRGLRVSYGVVEPTAEKPPPTAGESLRGIGEPSDDLFEHPRFASSFEIDPATDTTRATGTDP